VVRLPDLIGALRFPATNHEKPLRPWLTVIEDDYSRALRRYINE
jgi:hypothetical protein